MICAVIWAIETVFCLKGPAWNCHGCNDKPKPAALSRCDWALALVQDGGRSWSARAPQERGRMSLGVRRPPLFR